MDSVIRDDQGCIDGYIDRCGVYVDIAEHRSKVLEDANRLIKLVPDYYEGYLFRAYMSSGKYSDQLIADLRQAVKHKEEFSSKHTRYLNKIADDLIMYADTLNNKQILELYLQILPIFPNHFGVVIKGLGALAKHSKYDEMIKVFSNVTEPLNKLGDLETKYYSHLYSAITSILNNKNMSLEEKIDLEHLSLVAVRHALKHYSVNQDLINKRDVLIKNLKEDLAKLTAYAAKCNDQSSQSYNPAKAVVYFEQAKELYSFLDNGDNQFGSKIAEINAKISAIDTNSTHLDSDVEAIKNLVGQLIKNEINRKNVGAASEPDYKISDELYDQLYKAISDNWQRINDIFGGQENFLNNPGVQKIVKNHLSPDSKSLFGVAKKALAKNDKKTLSEKFEEILAPVDVVVTAVPIDEDDNEKNVAEAYGGKSDVGINRDISRESAYSPTAPSADVIIAQEGTEDHESSKSDVTEDIPVARVSPKQISISEDLLQQLLSNQKKIEESQQKQQEEIASLRKQLLEMKTENDLLKERVDNLEKSREGDKSVSQSNLSFTASLVSENKVSERHSF